MTLRGLRSSFLNWLRASRWKPNATGAAIRCLAGLKLPFDVSHLMAYPESDAMGPVQQSEALLLYSLTRVLQPRVIVEFGFNTGESAMNFLAAAPANCEVHSFDISEHSAQIAQRMMRDRRLRFHQKSQADFAAEDVGNREVDLVFIDASHDLALNQQTWRRLKGCMSPECVAVVHDTGTWPRDKMTAIHSHFVAHPATAAGWVSNDEFAHQLDERIFVNWIRETDPAFCVTHLHTTRVLRHGLSLIQRCKTLPISVGS
jgi:predicted O-methyltransferase YrrM